MIIINQLIALFYSVIITATVQYVLSSVKGSVINDSPLLQHSTTGTTVVRVAKDLDLTVIGQNSPDQKPPDKCSEQPPQTECPLRPKPHQRADRTLLHSI